MKVNYWELNWWLYKEGYINNEQWIKNKKFVNTLPNESGEVVFERGKTIKDSGLFSKEINLFNYKNENT